MALKQILSPDEVGELAPHWHELDKAKLDRIRTRSTRRVKLHGQHKSGEVLDVAPILYYARPHTMDRPTILNGKHRAAISFMRGVSLLAIQIATAAEIRHHVKLECLGDLTAEDLEELIDDRQKYLSIVDQNGTPTIRALVEKNRHLFIN